MRTLASAPRITFTRESNSEALVKSHAVTFLGNLVRHPAGSGVFGEEKERKCGLETFIGVEGANEAWVCQQHQCAKLLQEPKSRPGVPLSCQHLAWENLTGLLSEQLSEETRAQ